MSRSLILSSYTHIAQQVYVNAKGRESNNLTVAQHCKKVINYPLNLFEKH
ncbi:hypothetical protein PRUB_a5188 [Pseudoalteromonas rubra]|uniref:Uncharacterized protein n=1 Tax=Pseudoalteromonas rubra TaxID=43658 RepID=A0A8T0CAB1_9GAMM|nr:hypothetical protein PRUB_a5188 [Pseudoalteromonas rubra]